MDKLRRWVIGPSPCCYEPRQTQWYWCMMMIMMMMTKTVIIVMTMIIVDFRIRRNADFYANQERERRGCRQYLQNGDGVKVCTGEGEEGNCTIQ